MEKLFFGRALGKVLSALADLEDTEGHSAAAARFEQVALRYKYQAGEPESCAISHNNLAGYLKRASADPSGLEDPKGFDRILAHRLAAGAIRWQISSGMLPTPINNLANSTLPAAPPTFEQVVATVEEIEGVHFRELFARLPARAPNGDAAIAAVWQMAQERRAESVRRGAPDMDKVLREFDQLLRGIAAVAKGDDEPRAQIEAVLADLEEKGWHLTASVQRIWAGERDEAALMDGLDESDTQLVRRILELIQLPKDSEPVASSVEEVLASLPPAVRAAIEAGDVEALKAALGQLPPEQAAAIVEQLRTAGVIG